MDEFGDVIRPSIVFYGESLNKDLLKEAISAISNADLLIIAGTSLKVNPAAQLIHYFKGNNYVCVNRDVIPIKNYIQGNIGEVFKIIDEMT